MKAYRLLPSIVLACSLATASAQIPNGSFENWVDQGGYLDPVGWLTYNEVTTVGGPTVQQATPGTTGIHHVLVTTRASQGGGIPIQGWISAGSVSGQAGFPFTARPATLTGQWQYGIQPSDTGQVTVALTNSGSGALIAMGTLEVTGALSAWQSFSVPLTYFSTDLPDTAYIQIVSSINFSDPVIGSFVKVDDLAFSGTVGMDENLTNALRSVFPNPGTDHFTLSIPPDLHTITLFDATGRMVLQQRTGEELIRIGTDGLPVGIYIVRIVGRSGTVRQHQWIKS